MKFPRTTADAALCGMLIGAVLCGVFYLMHGELPPGWLVFVGTAIIMLPLIIWSASKTHKHVEDVPRETKEN